jgi:hypothetical protein
VILAFVVIYASTAGLIEMIVTGAIVGAIYKPRAGTGA